MTGRVGDAALTFIIVAVKIGITLKREISPETFEEWNRETGSAKLPERVQSAKKRSSRRKAKSKGGASKSKASSKRPSKRGSRHRSR